MNKLITFLITVLIFFSFEGPCHNIPQSIPDHRQKLLVLIILWKSLLLLHISLKKDLKYFSVYGKEVLIATLNGATVTNIKIEPMTGVTTYKTDNTSILSNNVVSVATGKEL